MGKPRLSLVAATMALWAWAASADERGDTIVPPPWTPDITKSSPWHMEPPKRPFHVWPSHPLHPSPTEEVVVRQSDKPYWTVGKADPVLSNACRLGRFVHDVKARFLVRFNGAEGRGLLAMIPPDRRYLLFDPHRLARPGETYYFRANGWGDCEVFFDGGAAPRKIDKTGMGIPRITPAEREVRNNAAKARAAKHFGKEG